MEIYNECCQSKTVLRTTQCFESRWVLAATVLVVAIAKQEHTQFTKHTYGYVQLKLWLKYCVITTRGTSWIIKDQTFETFFENIEKSVSP